MKVSSQSLFLSLRVPQIAARQQPDGLPIPDSSYYFHRSGIHPAI
jgi:hypothetical protein